ncbi:MAG: TldD/PmbA family protein [Thaumarchaeota archaeon]|nr:TldD/PmbA family protein [Nitrososphaerota archaeon]
MREQLTSSKNRTTSLDAQKAIKIALKNGAAYCDARIETYKEHGIVLENGQQEQSSASYDTGIGVRVLYDGAWGFFSTTDESKLEDGIISAIKSAKTTPKKNKVVLAQIPIDKKTINYPVRKNPEISELEKIARDCHDIMRRYKISKDIISALICQTSKAFESSEGAQIIQNYTDCTIDLVAIAHSGITQSINSTEGGRGGLETLDFVLESAKETASKSIELLDGVLGKEMAWAGGAWWAGKIGQKIGSESLNVIDDPTIPGSLGWYEYDDEGVRAQKKKLVQNGILTEHMHSRETASIFDSAPNAGMRATSYQFMPLIRMACTCIGPGKYNPEEIVKDVKDGYYVSNMKVPSIDMKRHNWSISAQYANKIEDGEIKELVRDVIIVGVAPEFFSSIDACGNDFTVRPITNCGKGDPMQQMKMGNGGPTIRGIATIRGAG